MALKIIGTDSDQELEVIFSGIGSITYFDQDGTPEFINRTYAGIANVNIRQTAITNPAAVVWIMFNPNSTRKVSINKVWLNCAFDGTSVATIMEYEVVKCVNVMNVTGGTILTSFSREETKKPNVIIRALDTGLTITSGSGYFDAGVMANVTCGRVSATTAAAQSWFLHDVSAIQSWPVVLQANEALAIRPTIITVVGDTLVGYVSFREYT